MTVPALRPSAAETETMTAEQYAQAIESCSGSLEQLRWQRAELAQKARDARIPYWVEIAARSPSVRRSVRRIYDWVATVDFRDDLPRRFNLPFSAFDSARRYVDKLDFEVIVSAMADAEQENINVEDLSKFLSDAAKPDTPPFCLEDELSELLIRVVAIRERAKVLDGRSDAIIERDDQAILQIEAQVGIEQSKLVKFA